MKKPKLSRQRWKDLKCLLFADYLSFRERWSDEEVVAIYLKARDLEKNKMTRQFSEESNK